MSKYRSRQYSQHNTTPKAGNADISSHSKPNIFIRYIEIRTYGRREFGTVIIRYYVEVLKGIRHFGVLLY